MSSADEASLPPPPSSPPTQPVASPLPPSFGGLPTELLLGIIEFLSHDDFLNFALAVYPILRAHDLVPFLTPEIYQSLIEQAPASNVAQSDQRENSDGYLLLPTELNDHIMNYLHPRDRIAWMFSHRALFRSYFQALSEETRKSLCKTLSNDNQRKQEKEIEEKNQGQIRLS